MNVLIVEDDESVARFLSQATSEAGFAPQVATNGPAALDLAKQNLYDIVLLDIMIPDLDGLEVCRRLRESKVEVPILILTAKDSLDDKVKGLDCGADDYLVKPFQVAELLARMRALMRRGPGCSMKLEVSDLALDSTTREVWRDGVLLTLSATEYALLEYLMKNAGRVLTRSMLLQHVWRYDFEGGDNVLDVYISYLRKKIDRGRETSLIRTVRGIGYRMGEP